MPWRGRDGCVRLVHLTFDSFASCAALGLQELFLLSADMERDIGKVYRKYERLERAIRGERDRKIANLPEQERLAISL
jgi:hypothetical protein